MSCSFVEEAIEAVAAGNLEVMPIAGRVTPP